jgi:hypothetical protein
VKAPRESRLQRSASSSISLVQRQEREIPRERPLPRSQLGRKRHNTRNPRRAKPFASLRTSHLPLLPNGPADRATLVHRRQATRGSNPQDPRRRAPVLPFALNAGRTLRRRARREGAALRRDSAEAAPGGRFKCGRPTSAACSGPCPRAQQSPSRRYQRHGRQTRAGAGRV